MKFRRAIAGIGLLAALAAGPILARAQLKIGQYEDEAPFRTWNTAPFITAASLGRGGTVFTLAADSSAALSNPALLPLLPRFSLAVNGAFEAASFAKTGPIGTGVFFTDGNAVASSIGLDFAGLAGRAGPWGFAVSISQAESYLRPGASYQESFSGGRASYLIQWNQTGGLRNLNVAVGRILGGGFSLGIGANYVFGSLRRSFVERLTGPGGYEISDVVTQDFRGIFFNGGLLWAPSSRFRAAAVFRTPYPKSSQGQSDLGYKAPDGNTDISITSASDDTIRQPLVLGLGASYDLSPKFVLAAEASFFGWSKYSLDEFGEKADRAFRDTVRLNLGLEFRNQMVLFGTMLDVPSRVGIIYDPQPMTDPSSAYWNITIGTGLAGKRVRLDLAALFGREWGSGSGLIARKIALSLGFQL
jgi:hypothetical protein